MTNHVINMSWARDKEKNLSPDRNNRSEFLSENISQAMLNLYMYWFWLFYYIFIYINIGSRKKTTLSSRQACFVSLNIYITLCLNVSSTVLRKNRNTDFLYIYIYTRFQKGWHFFVFFVSLGWAAGYSVVFLSFFFVFNLTGSPEIKSCHCTLIPCQPRLGLPQCLQYLWLQILSGILLYARL